MNQNEIKLYIINEENLTNITYMYKTYTVDLDQLSKCSDFILEKYNGDETHFSIYFPLNLREIQKSFNLSIVSIQAFMRILSGEIEPITDENCFDLYKLSKIYKIRKLNDSVIRFCRFKNRSIDDVANFYLKIKELEQADAEDKYLDEFVKKINIAQKLSDNIKECFNSDHFKKLSLNQIYEILEKCKTIPSDDLLDFIAESKAKRFPLLSFIDLDQLSEEKKDELSSSILDLPFILSQFCKLLTSNEEFLAGFKIKDDLYYSKYNRLKQSSDNGNICSSYFLSTLSKDKKEANEFLEKSAKQSCLASFFQKYNAYIESLQPESHEYSEENENVRPDEAKESKKKEQNDTESQISEKVGEDAQNESRQNLSSRSKESGSSKRNNKNISTKKRPQQIKDDKNETQQKTNNRLKEPPGQKRRSKSITPNKKSQLIEDDEQSDVRTTDTRRSKEVISPQRKAKNISSRNTSDQIEVDLYIDNQQNTNNHSRSGTSPQKINRSSRIISDQTEEDDQENRHTTNNRSRESSIAKRRSRSVTQTKKSRDIEADDQYDNSEGEIRYKRRNKNQPNKKSTQPRDYNHNDVGLQEKEAPSSKRRSRNSSPKTISDQIEEDTNNSRSNDQIRIKESSSRRRSRSSPQNKRMIQNEEYEHKNRSNEKNYKKESPSPKRMRNLPSNKRSNQIDEDEYNDNNLNENHYSRESPVLKRRSKNQSPKKRPDQVEDDDYIDSNLNENHYSRVSPSTKRRSKPQTYKKKSDHHPDYDHAKTILNENYYSRDSPSPKRRSRNRSSNQRSDQIEEYDQSQRKSYI